MNKLTKVITVLLVLLAIFTFGVVSVPAASVTLAWDASPDGSVVGYNIYYGGATRAYTNKVNVGNVTNSTITNLTLGATYYFAATAYANTGLESDYSNEATYSVPTNFYPTITLQPTSRAVNKGTNTTFTVAATGIGTLGYQWRFNSVNLAGETNTALTLTNIQATNAGSYVAVVNNQYGAVTSQVAVLTVNLPPTVVNNFRILSVQPTN